MAGNIINILLVQNDPAARDFIMQALAGCSASVQFCAETAGSIAETMQYIRNESFDVVLLDMNLPDSKGVETVTQIRSMDQHIPIVVMIELADEEIGLQALKHGADDYLIKGRIFKDVLGRSIRYAVERKSQQQRAEQSLRDEKNKAQKYLDVAQVVLLVLDKNQRVTLINKKGCEILGCPEHEILGKDWCENFVPLRVRELVRMVISTTLRGDIEPIEYFENPILTSAGTERIVAWRNSVLSDVSGQVEAVLCSGEDITERKHAEQQKTRLLAQVESINRELKDFAYIISHDLKAPLRGIKTLADWISTDYADKLNDDGREHLHMLTARVDRMHSLIDGVLQYSRVGRIREKTVEIDINQLVTEVIDIVAPPENIEITIENQLPVIIFERTRMIQIFQNLLSNAVKYMDKPQGLITVGCADENGHWRFSVADNGPGIDRKNFERVFQIFQTLTPSDNGESTGVGLTVVKKIVETYKGRIWLESALGRGTTFFFTLLKSQTKNANEKLEAAVVG